jgi:hypothetical protein
MPYILTRIDVGDYDMWKPMFPQVELASVEEAEDFRR